MISTPAMNDSQVPHSSAGNFAAEEAFRLPFPSNQVSSAGVHTQYTSLDEAIATALNPDNAMKKRIDLGRQQKYFHHSPESQDPAGHYSQCDASDYGYVPAVPPAQQNFQHVNTTRLPLVSRRSGRPASKISQLPPANDKPHRAHFQCLEKRFGCHSSNSSDHYFPRRVFEILSAQGSGSDTSEGDMSLLREMRCSLGVGPGPSQRCRAKIRIKVPSICEFGLHPLCGALTQDFSPHLLAVDRQRL